jgi:RAV-like factor
MAFLPRFSATSVATTESATDATAAFLATVGSSSQESGGGGAVDDDVLPRQPPRLKGVVPQPTGRWGAQIYEGLERVWLGTFLDRETAARAYDVAALRYRGGGAVTNFPPAAPRQLMAFLAAHSKSEVVDMLRNKTYADELQRGVRGRDVPAPPAWARVPLFEKAVTPSDVGRLHRLVVPKKHAERHLPPLRAPEREGSGGKAGVVVLAAEDGEGKVWRFRYSYWQSSRSYVLTKGWIRFVREKGLRAGDTIAFSRWTFGPEERLIIDCRKKPEKNDDATSVKAPIVKLFGVDIAIGGRGNGLCGGRTTS